MILITILICLIVQRYVGFGPKLHSIGWFEKYVHSLYSIFGKSSLWQGVSGVIIMLLPLLMVIGVLQILLYDRFYNVLAFLLGLIVLFYCLDFHNLKKQLADYFSAYKKGSEQAALRYGSTFVQSECPNNLPQLTRAITREIFIHADEHIFGVIFWYVLLGPTGGLFYYLVAQTARSGKQFHPYLANFAETAEKIRQVLDWIPVRITGLTYALVGHFNYAFSHWLEHLKMGVKDSREFAISSGLEALELDQTETIYADVEENYMALALIDKALIVWIVIIAIFTLGALLP